MKIKLATNPFHARNRHKGRYDFRAMTAASPEFKKFITVNDYKEESIDFSNPDAVKALNTALIKSYYGLSFWDFPENYLCPAVPGRADYVHTLADLLKGQTGTSVRVLDIGIGANCIYPIIGFFEYGWSFVGSDIDKAAIDSCQKIIDANDSLQKAVQLRLQENKNNILNGVIHPGDRFNLVMCNPPFHSSFEEAQAASRRKWNNLGRDDLAGKNKNTNFGGQSNELWCNGGEVNFIQRLINESFDFRHQVGWFSTLVSKQENLPRIEEMLMSIQPKEMEAIPLSHGNKKTRIVVWRF